MSDQDVISIQVYIAGRSYPLKVKESDAPVIKRIADEINEKINHFQRTYANRDKQDCLSMALLTYAVDLQRLQDRTSSEQLSEKVKSINLLLEELLQ